jgi:hypothetical protein
MTREPAANAVTAAPRWRAPAFVGPVVRSLPQDAHALRGAGRKSLAGIRVVFDRRRTSLGDTLGELRAVGQVLRHVGAREGIAHLDALARGALQLTLANMRELAALAAATQKEALDVLARRLHDDLQALRRLRSRRRAARAD